MNSLVRVLCRIIYRDAYVQGLLLTTSITRWWMRVIREARFHSIITVAQIYVISQLTGEKPTMSVILTSARLGSQQRAERDKQEKKKAAKRAEKSRRLKKAEMEELRRSLGPLPEQNDSVRVWTFVLENKAHAVIFYVENLDVFVDRVKLDAITRYTEHGAALDFDFYGYDGVIDSVVPLNSKRGTKPRHSLLIDGQTVPTND